MKERRREEAELVPDVDLDAVGHAADDFGRHPVGRADERAAPRVRRVVLGDLRREAEVGELHAAVGREEDRVALDVAVQHAVHVQERQRVQHRAAHHADLLLAQPKRIKYHSPSTLIITYLI